MEPSYFGSLDPTPMPGIVVALYSNYAQSCFKYYSYKKYLYKFFERNLVILEQKYPDRIEEIKSNYIKRITPSELTSSAFFDKLPIQKSEIDSIIDNVCLSLYNKRFNTNTSV